MEFTEYQNRAHKLARYPEKQGLTYTALGLAGEAGEYADKVKKVIRDDGGNLSPEKRLELAKEAGDVLWYLQEVAGVLGYDLVELACMNLEKLEDRNRRNVLHGSGDNR